MPQKVAIADIPRGKLLCIFSVQAVVLTAVGGLLWYISGREIADFVQFGQFDISLGLALGAGLSVIGGIAFFAFPRVSDRLVVLQGDQAGFLKNKLSWPAIGLISLAAGFGEEALFRGGLQVLLTDYLGPVAAIAISAALFALVHFAKPSVAILIFIIGAIFGAIYWYTGSLLAVMMGHALYDMFALWYLQRRLHELDFFGTAKAGAVTETE